MQAVTDTLAPVCASVIGLSGGLAGAQRACFARLWVFPKSITLMQPTAYVTRALTDQTIHTHTNRALLGLAAELWPS